MKATKLLSKQKGFTLVELLIVIAIIGILMGLALAGMRFAQRRARDLERQNAVRNVATALEAYYVDNRAYPAGSTTFQALVSGTTAPLNPYLEGQFELPANTQYTTFGYATDANNTNYIVCVYPEGVSNDPTKMYTAGSDESSTMKSTCSARITTPTNLQN